MLSLIEISLICTGIHVCFMEGMFFYSLRRWIELFIELVVSIFVPFKVGWFDKVKRIVEWITKPLYDCLPCMASFWTIVLMWEIDIKAILIVCGINVIIASILQFFDNTKLPENDN